MKSPSANIIYRVVNGDDADESILALLEEYKNQVGIVIGFSREDVFNISKRISGTGTPVLEYTSKLGEEERRNLENRFLAERGVVLVATSLFKNQITRKDIRFVAHVGLPQNLIDYIQQVGFAGRDGETAEVWMRYDKKDIEAKRKFIDYYYKSDGEKEVAKNKLNEVIAYCEDAGCRRSYLLRYLGFSVEGPCGVCDNCQKGTRLWNGTRNGTQDIENHKKAIEKVPGIKFSGMGGFGRISCCECSFSEKNTSFLHGLRSADGNRTSSKGYQCVDCGEFAAVAPEDDLLCKCGGNLSRDHLLFCPTCKSTKLTYKMMFIT
jgi:superfamily II DNA helicase RecQ